MHEDFDGPSVVLLGELLHQRAEVERAAAGELEQLLVFRQLLRRTLSVLLCIDKPERRAGISGEVCEQVGLLWQVMRGEGEADVLALNKRRKPPDRRWLTEQRVGVVFNGNHPATTLCLTDGALKPAEKTANRLIERLARQCSVARSHGHQHGVGIAEPADDLKLRRQLEGAGAIAGDAAQPNSVFLQQVRHRVDAEGVDFFSLAAMRPGPEVDLRGPRRRNFGEDVC